MESLHPYIYAKHVLWLFVLFRANCGFAVSVTADEFTVEIITPTEARADMSSSPLPLIGPAIDLAVSEMNEFYGRRFVLHRTYLFDSTARTCADTLAGADYMVAEYYYRRKVVSNATVFIFPGGCAGMMEGIAKLAQAYTNLIQISPAALGAAFDTYYGFMRTFDWRTIYLIGDLGSPSRALAVGSPGNMAQELRQRNCTVYLGIINSAEGDYPFDQVLSDIRQNSRVISFFGHALPLRRFMIRAYLMNMTSSDYVYIFLDHYEYPTPSTGNVTWQNHDADDPIAFEAFRSIFVVKSTTTLSKEGIQARDLMFTELISRSKRDYNYTYAPKVTPSPIILAPYAAVTIFAQVLYSVLENRTDPSNKATSIDTASLARLIAGQVFQTKVGAIAFNALGERRILMDVNQLDAERGTFKPVFRQNTTYPTNLDTVWEILWCGGRPPPSIPPCGYSGFVGPCSPVSRALRVTAPVVCLIVAGVIGFIVAFRAYQRNAVLSGSFKDYEVAANLLQPVSYHEHILSVNF